MDVDDKRLTKVSKYLAKHLRHRPERLGLQLEPGGWVQVDVLLAACRRADFQLSPEELVEVVTRNDKRRFSFDTAGTRIRANQGHSVDIDLQLEAVEPPSILYHGTGHTTVEAILSQGLQRMGRHHVHLSSDVGTAMKVGARHGRPAVLVIDAAGMHADGATFLRTDNEVWLTEHVPPDRLEVLT
jgi:putative RNA 2'-phosphotransferase